MTASGCQQCIAGVERGFEAVKGVLGRLLYMAHNFVCVFGIWRLWRYNWYWLLLLPLVPLVVETFITIKIFKGEYRWFSPSVFCFLMINVPCTWLMEIYLLKERLKDASQPTDPLSLFLASSSVTQQDNLFEGINVGIRFQLNMAPKDWVPVLEQLTFIVLILGRWLSPKGRLSRDELSALLIVNIGLGADILELLDHIRDGSVSTTPLIIYVTLILWTMAVMQFCMVLTTVKARSFVPMHQQAPSRVKKHCLRVFETEIWAILTTLLLQDAPFLAYRLTLLIKYRVLTQSNLFFTSKNALLVLLELYRIVVISCTAEQDDVINFTGDERPSSAKSDEPDDRPLRLNKVQPISDDGV